MQYAISETSPEPSRGRKGALAAKNETVLAKRCRAGHPIITKRLLRAVLCATLIAGPQFASDSSEPSLEYRVKAAFLLNFTRFIDWPQTDIPTTAPFTVCILGSNPFGGTLEQTVEGENVNGRKMVVRRVRRDEANSCQMIYVDRSEKDVSAFLRSLGKGILTVGEGDAFLRQGGMIAFVIDNRHVRFDVSQAAASNADIRISSRLLNVARFVER